jgi:tetratricopeptide (TPR) repeat protein
MRTRWWVALGLVVAASLVAVPRSVAGPAEDTAREATRRAGIAYNLGRYDDAAAEYERAYEAVPDPVLLFNIGQSYRQAGKPEKALVSYRAYLRTAPTDAPNRAQVEVRVRELETLVVQQKASQAAPPPGTLPAPSPTPASAPAATPPSAAPVLVQAPEPAHDEPRPVYTRWWFWTAVGGVLVLGAVGIALASRGDPDLFTGDLPPGKVGVPLR